MAEKIRIPSMTPREIEVLWLVGEGYTLDEIGVELGISSRTAKEYSDRLRAKWDVKRKLDLARIARAYDRGEIW